MPNLDDLEALDEDGIKHRALLEDLQCNILSSHERPNTHYFFLTFSKPEQARHALRALAEGGKGLPCGLALESELRSRGRRREKEKKAKPARYEPVSGFSTNLMLTALCYTDLLPDLHLPRDAAFRQGMADRGSTLSGADRLNDPERLRRATRSHAIYAVGYDPAAEDWGTTRELITGWLRAQGATVRNEEEGHILRHPTKHHAIEPFGYRDAISQPVFFQQDLKDRAKHGGTAALVGGGQWSSFAPLSLVLVPEPNPTSEHSHGTYVAYRKLRQNVDLFYEQAEALAAAAPVLPGAARLQCNEVADRLLGRKLDGTTLDGSSTNDFTYPTNSVCPKHAHVRKVNPREPYARPHRIVRRATVFGPQLKREEDGRPKLPTESAGGARNPSVGLLFFSCQADIKNQFEFIQAHWANDLSRGADTVIGQPPVGSQNRIGLNGSGLTLSYAPVVEVLEGDYFFVPSISFFSLL
jgi:Dyp-type peroxidase family